MWREEVPRLRVPARRIDSQVESFKRSRPKQRQVTRFGEDHLVDGKKLVKPDDRKAHAAGYPLTVGEDKAISFFSRAIPIFSSVRSETQEHSLPVSTSSFGMITDRLLSTEFSNLHLVWKVPIQ